MSESIDRVITEAQIDLSDYSDEFVAGFAEGWLHALHGVGADGEPFVASLTAYRALEAERDRLVAAFDDEHEAAVRGWEEVGRLKAGIGALVESRRSDSWKDDQRSITVEELEALTKNPV